jgi:hypothetical protein
VLGEEKRAIGTQNSCNFGKDLFWVFDRAEDKGRDDGIHAGIVEGKPLGRRLHDRRVQWRPAGALSELRRHGLIRFGQQHLGDSLGIVAQVETGTGP